MFESLKLKRRLIKLRKNISIKKNILEYYVFTNKELKLLIKKKPTTIEHLSRILPSVKVKSNGKEIIEAINNF